MSIHILRHASDDVAGHSGQSPMATNVQQSVQDDSMASQRGRSCPCTILHELQKMQNELRVLCGSTPQQHTSSLGNIFYVNDVQESVMQVSANSASISLRHSQHLERRILPIQKLPSTFTYIQKRLLAPFRRFGRQRVGKSLNLLNSRLCSPEVYDNSLLMKFQSSPTVDWLFPGIGL